MLQYSKRAFDFQFTGPVGSNFVTNIFNAFLHFKFGTLKQTGEGILFFSNFIQ